MRFLSNLIIFLLVCSPVWGATQLKKTVCPSGCDYTSLEACMNANEQNLVTADKYLDVEISGTWSSADTTAVTIHNYTTDATRYINIYTTGSARHDGREKAVSGRSNYVLSVTSGLCFNINAVNITIDGLEITSPKGDGSANGGIRSITSAFDGIIKNNIFHDIGYPDGYWQSAAIFTNDYSSVTMFNNIIYKVRGGGIRVYNEYGGTKNIYNNTVYAYGRNGEGYPGIHIGIGTVKNNLVINSLGSTGGDYLYVGSVTTGTNGASDTTGTPDGLDNLTASNLFVNVTAGSEDLHLKAGASAIDAGTDLGSPYNVDIDGTTRSGTWDIGADEYVSAVVPSLPSVLNDIYVTPGTDTITFN